jgi:hypothetical protein
MSGCRKASVDVYGATLQHSAPTERRITPEYSSVPGDDVNVWKRLRLTQRSHQVSFLKGNGKKIVKKAAVILCVVMSGGHVGAQGSEVLARFDGGIGVNPVSSFASPLNYDGTFQNVTRNFVRGVRSSTAIWRIADLKADVSADGRIRVEGRGLLLASGDHIGQNANQSVFATLICEAAAPFVERNSAATINGIEFVGQVPLEANGDVRIDDTLRVPGGGAILCRQNAPVRCCSFAPAMARGSRRGFPRSGTATNALSSRVKQ